MSSYFARQIVAPKLAHWSWAPGQAPVTHIPMAWRCGYPGLYKQRGERHYTTVTAPALTITPCPTHSSSRGRRGRGATPTSLRHPDVTILQFSDTTTKSDRHHPSGLTYQPSHINRATRHLDAPCQELATLAGSDHGHCGFVSPNRCPSNPSPAKVASS